MEDPVLNLRKLGVLLDQPVEHIVVSPVCIRGRECTDEVGHHCRPVEIMETVECTLVLDPKT